MRAYSHLFFRILVALVIGHWLVFIAAAQPAFPTNVVIKLVQEGNVTLAWDRAASHTNLASFGLLTGVRSGVYNQRLDCPTNLTTCTVSNLPSGATYFFAVVARNVAGLDSDPSNEISYTIERPAPPPSVRTAQIKTMLEFAPFPEGPWTNLVAFSAINVAASSDQRFFRVRLNSIPSPMLPHDHHAR